MATRNLTEVFLLMRNNAMQSRHIYSEQIVSDRMSLVSSDLESGIRGTSSSGDSRLPPIWADGIEEVHYAMTRLRSRIQDLEALHQKHLLRPTLDDSGDAEAEIEIQSQEISRMFAGAHRLVQQIKQRSRDGSKRERQLADNVLSSLVSTLTDLSHSFRKAQSSYLKSLNSREERSKEFFDTDMKENITTLDDAWQEDSIEEDSHFGAWAGGVSSGSQLTQQQLLLVEEDHNIMLQRREAEVRSIVKSILDLNEIFKDLAHMVADQGTVLDRIDYNLEHTQYQVHEGYKQLQKAERYQRKNRKMMCIMILSGITLFLLIILIITKS